MSLKNNLQKTANVIIPLYLYMYLIFKTKVKVCINVLSMMKSNKDTKAPNQNPLVHKHEIYICSW